MKISSAVAGLSLLVVLALGSAARATDADRPFLDLGNAHLGVWHVVYERKGSRNYNSFGTAFAIRSNLFVTNAHVLRAMVRVRGTEVGMMKLYPAPGNSRSALAFDRVLSLSDVHDLAYFRTKSGIGNKYFAVFRALPEQPLGPLTAIGFPAQGEDGKERPTFRRMRSVAGPWFSDPAFGESDVAVDTDQISGASGGPVLNARGAVVGVTRSDGANFITFVRAEVLWDFIKFSDVRVNCRSDTFTECLDRADRDLMEAARRGDPVAMYHLWFEFERNGRNVTGGSQADYVGLLMRSAKQGYVQAQLEAGWVHMEGNGVLKNTGMGRFWFERAARRGHAEAQYTMGRIYLNRGDTRQARKWLERAAAQGYWPARDRLEEMGAEAAD